MTRIRFLPWHVFLGLYTYGLAVVTAETGLLEKLTFLQTKGVVLKHCTESLIVNCLGLGLATLCGVVILTAVSPKQYQSSHTTKVVNSNSKCLTFQPNFCTYARSFKMLLHCSLITFLPNNPFDLQVLFVMVHDITRQDMTYHNMMILYRV